MRPMVVTIWATSGASASLRIRTIVDDRAHERRGDEHREHERDEASARPRSTWNFQKTNARNIPIAPWAKLKMPDVV